MSLQSSDIITFDVPDDVIQKALHIREQRDKLFGNYFSIADKDMRHCGEIGEIMLWRALQQAAGPYAQWHHEGKVKNEPDFTVFGRTFDLKTVKRKVPMRLNYEAQVSAKQIHTPVDDYVFACYEYPTQKLHVLGAISKPHFFEKAQYFGEGEQVHKDYKIREGHDIYNIRINQLNAFRHYLQHNKEIVRQQVNKNSA